MKTMLRAIIILWREELKALLRGQFAWVGAGTILLALAVLAAAGTQDAWLDVYGIIAYGLVPLAFIPIAAGVIANPRANRFVECVFTAPVERRDWLLAKLLTLATLAALYWLALLPLMAVYVAHVGMPPLLSGFLAWSLGLLAVSVAIGALTGVLFIGRSLAAPAGAGMALLLLYAGLIPLQELMIARGYGATRAGRVTLVSPAVLLKNALGFTLAAPSIPATTSLTWLCVAAVCLGAIALAIWVFLRAQGVETWEATPAQRSIITVALFAILLLPPLVADTNYDKPAPPPSRAPAVRALFARAGSSLALTPPGDALPVRCCGTILNRDTDPIATGERSTRDLLLLLPLDSTDRISEVDIHVEGENGLQISAGAQRMETHDYPNETGPAAADGHHVAKGLVARVPITLQPTNPWDIGGNRYPLSVRATYRIDGDPRPRSFSARAAIEAGVGTAIQEMSLAGLILPIACFAAAIRRRRLTR
jgi:hypothetical protein